MNKVILIYGQPSTGKLTIAKKIQEKLIKSGKKCYLFDNHYFNDIVYPYLDITPNLNNICKGVYEIRDIFFDLLAKYNNFNNEATLIFTNVLFDTRDDKKSVKKIKKFAKQLNAKFYTIRLESEYEDILKRCTNKDRAKKNKINDVKLLRWCIEEHSFLSLKDSFCINTSNDDINTCANQIIKHIS